MSLAIHRLLSSNCSTLMGRPTAMTATEMLAKHPKCAYTTARCFDDAVFELGRHLARLRASHAALGSPASRSVSAEDFERSVMATMAASLRGALAVSSSSSTPKKDFFSETPSPTSIPVRNSKMIVLVTHEDEIYALTETMKERKPNELIRCVIRGNARTNPLVKDSQWVLDRKSIVDDSAEDTLLTNPADEDEILEGTQTNFFVVDSHNRVVTAPNGTVLAGTIRDVVLEACEDLKIEVVMKCPRWSEREREFKEAFLTSTSRLVMKIDVIERGTARFSFPFLNSRLKFSDTNSVTRRISDWVLREVPKRCSKL